MLSLFIVPFVFINLGSVESTSLLFGLYILSGLGMAGVGMVIMHDSLHGSFSENRILNKLMGYSINLLGSSASLWKIQHNILHHTYTNVEGADDDINVPGVLRFSPSQKLYWFHKYQHLYVWPFYCLMTISWSTFKDFVKISRYSKLGFIKDQKEVTSEIVKNIAIKVFFYSFTLIVPMIVASQPFWVVFLAYLSMHFVTGLTLSVIFQIAHVMPTSEFPLPDENGKLENAWAAHQLYTTTNFAPKNKVLSWLIGGLNYQIEHHLLPNISHVHYSKISPIVEETAKEFGLPYNVKKTFGTAVIDHARMLKLLGNQKLELAKS